MRRGLVSAALLVALLPMSFAVLADDLGVVGPTYEIVERDVLELITSKLKQMEQSGELAKYQEDYKNKVVSNIEHPRPLAGFKSTETAGTRYYDPSVVTEKDIVDATGKVLYARGTRVNPLDYIGWNSYLLFVDGRDEKQLSFGHIYKIEHILLKARAIQHRAYQHHHRIDVPVRLIERTGTRVVFLRLSAVGGIEAGIEFNPAHRAQAEWLAHHIDVTHRFPKAEFHPKVKAAHTNGRSAHIGRVLLPGRDGDGDGTSAKYHWKRATPTDVGDQIGKLPLTIQRRICILRAHQQSQRAKQRSSLNFA